MQEEKNNMETAKHLPSNLHDKQESTTEKINHSPAVENTKRNQKCRFAKKQRIVKRKKTLQRGQIQEKNNINQISSKTNQSQIKNNKTVNQNQKNDSECPEKTLPEYLHTVLRKINSPSSPLPFNLEADISKEVEDTSVQADSANHTCTDNGKSVFVSVPEIEVKNCHKSITQNVSLHKQPILISSSTLVLSDRNQTNYPVLTKKTVDAEKTVFLPHTALPLHTETTHVKHQNDNLVSLYQPTSKISTTCVANNGIISASSLSPGETKLSDQKIVSATKEETTFVLGNNLEDTSISTGVANSQDQTKCFSELSPDDNSSSATSAVTVVSPTGRQTPKLKNFTQRRDLSSSKHSHYTFSSDGSRYNKKKKSSKLNKVKKPKPFKLDRAKYKIKNQKPDAQHQALPTCKPKVPYLVNRFLKSSEGRNKKIKRVKKSVPLKPPTWQQCRSFVRVQSNRSFGFSRPIFPYHSPDPINTHQLLNSSSYPKPSHLIGFKNFGNTCYMNAVLQALTGLTRFCTCILSSPTEQGLVGALKQLLSVYKDGNDPTTSLRSFREYFVTDVFPQFDNNNQHDASEFLITLINQGIKEAHLFHDFFQFKYIEEIKCKACSKEMCSVVQQDVMMNLMILKQETGINSVQMLMRNQLATCQACKSDTAACTYKFISLPRVLILVMQRYCHNQSSEDDFRHTVKKIKTPFNLSHTLQVHHLVVSPETFSTQPANISPSLSEQMGMDSKIQLPVREFEASHVLQYYHLSAVVCHIGDGTNIGHYLADVYRSSVDGWFHYNDEGVSCTMFDQAELKENCYLLFYSLNK